VSRFCRPRLAAKLLRFEEQTLGEALGWSEIFGAPIIAAAILDRILHHSTTVNIKGNSYRLRKKFKEALIREPEVEES